MAVKERVGVVVSNKMDKTAVVAVENRSPHPKYRKIVVKTKKIQSSRRAEPMFRRRSRENQRNSSSQQNQTLGNR